MSPGPSMQSCSCERAAASTRGCLPQIENLRSFTEDQARLASADQFYLLLLNIPWSAGSPRDGQGSRAAAGPGPGADGRAVQTPPWGSMKGGG